MLGSIKLGKLEKKLDKKYIIDQSFCYLQH